METKNNTSASFEVISLEQLPKLIKELREEHGWNQRELAERVDLSSSMISQIEAGKAIPSKESLEKLARVLGFSVKFSIEVSILDRKPRTVSKLPRPDLVGILSDLVTNLGDESLSCEEIVKQLVVKLADHRLISSRVFHRFVNSL